MSGEKGNAGQKVVGKVFISEGYQPTEGSLNTNRPPKGGSGVPPLDGAKPASPPSDNAAHKVG